LISAAFKRLSAKRRLATSFMAWERKSNKVKGRFNVLFIGLSRNAKAGGEGR